MKYSVSVDGEQFEVEIAGTSVTVSGEVVDAELTRAARGQLALLRVGGRRYRVALGAVARSAGTAWPITLNGRKFYAVVLDDRARRLQQLARSSGARHGPSRVLAPMPGLIVKVNVAVGDKVEAGRGLLIMEAMKMENELRAAGAGVVTAIYVSTGTAVEKGTVLVELE